VILCKPLHKHKNHNLKSHRIMRPNRPHMVFTLEDSILVGGHFYCPSTFDLSLAAGLQEHLFGRSSTNAAHLASETILYRTIRYYQHLLEMRDIHGRLECMSITFLTPAEILTTIQQTCLTQQTWQHWSPCAWILVSLNHKRPPMQTTR
jgi:hypothetical protein